MRTIDDMMPILSLCHGQGSKMNFLVSDYIRVDTANLTLHHLCPRASLALEIGEIVCELVVLTLLQSSFLFVIF